ncbi:glutathione S-transferase omega-1-like [Physella acuta]|uniref:glutathione S-transferase omega-1-like n=1 Tax=Physella acuta TaxID=109671 RepID=UPI0027DC3376|nr:glutathione S-transferase omega-1-like [Physella acuta]XP_059156090.1 glutathione S-transferase omega-1-like [Physella acuta]XP_059156091.1 glutathione S-transferase omega-1-like [Physella acuta]XP_059156092.1 glutathione S-transferase omega-1-like [Physella acuta]
MTQKSFQKGTPLPPLQPGLLRLYSMRFCPFAQRTRLVLLYKNIPFETINVDLKHKPDWFFDKNPLGLVPIVELDDKIIYESTATCEWLDDIYPQHRLQPSDPYTKAWDRTLLEYFGKLTTLIYAFLREPDKREKNVEELQKHLKFYEDTLAKRTGPFFGGETPSMIDFYLWPHFERIPVLESIDTRAGVSKDNFPHLATWFDVMCQLPAVKATMWDAKTHLHFIQSYASGKPDYDFGLVE